MSDVRNTIIIGSGPAGLTAAIYTARASLAPLVIEGEPSSTSDQPGGQLMLTTEVENFPGWPEGIQGPELMMRFKEQASRFGAEFVTEKVTKVDFSQRPFTVWVRDQEYKANSVIVATARGLVFGLLAAFGIVAVIVVLGIGITRGLQDALDAGLPRDAAVWVSYFVLSGLCFLAGTLLMRKRFKSDEESGK